MRDYVEDEPKAQGTGARGAARTITTREAGGRRTTGVIEAWPQGPLQVLGALVGTPLLLSRPSCCCRRRLSI